MIHSLSWKQIVQAAPFQSSVSSGQMARVRSYPLCLFSRKRIDTIGGIELPALSPNVVFLNYFIGYLAFWATLLHLYFKFFVCFCYYISL